MYLIEACPLGIHDLCRTELDPAVNLPRFNMPLELGLFLGARRYGSQRDKRCLVLDKEPYRFRLFISDISGQDVHSHENQVETLIGRVRDFLRTVSPGPLPGGARIHHDFIEFEAEKGSICTALDLVPADVTFTDFVYIVAYYLKGPAT